MRERVSPGQHYLTNPLVRRTATVNGVLDMLHKHQLTERGGPTQRPVGTPLSPCEILIRAPADLDAGSIVEIGDYYLDEMDAGHLWFEGIDSSTTAEQLAVVRFAVKEGELVKAIIDGACMARVNVSSLSHRYANPEVSGRLSSSASGRLWIMTTPTVTGIQSLPVRFHTYAQTAIAKTGGLGVTARSGTSLGSGTVTLYRVNGGSIEETSNTATALNVTSSAVAADTFIQLKGIDGAWFVDVEDCGA